MGTGARYLLSTWMLRTLGAGFPYGTLAVNLVGSFLLGALMQVALASESFSPTLRLALGTGVLGGFTTYSSFNQETLGLMREGSLGLGFAYLAVTVITCLAAGLLGLWAARLLTGAG